MKELRELKSRPPKVVEKPDTKEADAQIKSLKEKLARAMAKLDRFESDA